MKRYISRALEAGILAASRQFPVLLVTGPRQTGKTTLLMHLKDDARKYVSLDSIPIRILAREDPELFLQKYGPPVIIDEIQYAPELLSAIKMNCDASGKKGLFWLTGSQQFHLMRGVTESLAGRVAIVTLNGLSEREVDGADGETAPFLPFIGPPRRMGRIYDEPSMFRRIFAGSYPALLSGEVLDTDLFYASYVRTYLERDLHELSQTGNLETFYTFLKVLAGRTGSMLNMSEVSRDCAVSVPTVKHWISILVATSLVYLLRPFPSNRGSRLIKTPKLYFLDTGLCAHLAGYSSPETLASGPLRGAIFETWCVSEVLKSWWYALKEPPVWYYRDKDGAEIDLLFEADGALYPAEIKLGAGPRKDWLRHFSSLQRLGLPVRPGSALCLAREPFPIDRDNIALPAGWI
jgi:predicted AAA+ superfamily ATPase